MVQQWNKLAEDTVVGSNAFQNEGLIYMVYVSAAVYDAVAALEGGASRTVATSLRLRERRSRQPLSRLPTRPFDITFLRKRPHSLPGATKHWRSFRTGQPN